MTEHMTVCFSKRLLFTYLSGSVFRNFGLSVLNSYFDEINSVKAFILRFRVEFISIAW